MPGRVNGFQYEDPDDAIYASDKFQDWAKERAIKEPEDGWPQFETPQDVISYDIPGVTIPGRHITNNDVAPDFKMNVGKAFMLDGYERSPYGGLISLVMATGMPLSTSKPAKNLEKMRAKHSAKKGSAVKGGAGSGYFAPHSGRPGARGGSAPRFMSSRKISAAIAEKIELPNGYKTQILEKKKRGDEEGIILDGEGNKAGSFGFTLRREGRPATDIHVGLLALEPQVQNSGLALDFLEGVVEYARGNGYKTVSLTADITIGRYAWARYGFRYDEAPDMGEVKSEYFELWAKDKGIQEPPGGWPHFKTPQDVIGYDIPGVRLKGSDIKNKDVSADFEMNAGKAFMLENGVNGHGDWNAVIDVETLAENLVAMRAKHDAKHKGSAVKVEPAVATSPRTAAGRAPWRQRPVCRGPEARRAWTRPASRHD